MDFKKLHTVYASKTLYRKTWIESKTVEKNIPCKQYSQLISDKDKSYINEKNESFQRLSIKLDILTKKKKKNCETPSLLQTQKSI